MNKNPRRITIPTNPIEIQRIVGENMSYIKVPIVGAIEKANANAKEYSPIY